MKIFTNIIFWNVQTVSLWHNTILFFRSFPSVAFTVCYAFSRTLKTSLYLIQTHISFLGNLGSCKSQRLNCLKFSQWYRLASRVYFCNVRQNNPFPSRNQINFPTATDRRKAVECSNRMAAIKTTMMRKLFRNNQEVMILFTSNFAGTIAIIDIIGIGILKTIILVFSISFVEFLWTLWSMWLIPRKTRYAIFFLSDNAGIKSRVWAEW